MLLKNKIYSGIIIVIFILCLIIGLNENIIGKPLGEKVFYLLNCLFFVLLIIGTTKKKGINIFLLCSNKKIFTGISRFFVSIIFIILFIGYILEVTFKGETYEYFKRFCKGDLVYNMCYFSNNARK